MIVGLGVDLIGITKIERMAERESFRRRVFTARELAEAGEGRSASSSLAGKFAAKEAFLKALGVGLGQGVRLVDIESLKGPDGRPEVEIGPRAAERLAASGAIRVHVSLSHSAGFAIAVVILEGPGPTQAHLSGVVRPVSMDQEGRRQDP